MIEYMKIITNKFNDALRLYLVAFYFAAGDIKARYRRSVIGPFWIVLSTILSVALFGLVWGTLLNMEKSKFIPSVVTGFILWYFISGCLVESPSIFLHNVKIIRNIKTSLFIFPVQVILKHLIIFFHNALIILVVLLIYPPVIINFWLLLLAFFGLFLLVANLLWIGIIFSMIGARFRDLEPLVASIMPVLFFISPVIYTIDRMPVNSSFIVWSNPFTYFISIVRAPLMGQVPEHFVYYTVIGMLIGGWTLTLWLTSKKYKRIPFWI